jgi:hypothetical protein
MQETHEVTSPMTMLELLDALVELLGGQRADGVGPLPVEKYRRLDRADRPVVYVTPVVQEESAVALGGQFQNKFQVEVRCEIPWETARADGDLLLRLVDRLLAVVEKNRDVGEAKRGRVGQVRYGYELRRDGGHVFVATLPVEFTADRK